MSTAGLLLAGLALTAVPPAESITISAGGDVMVGRFRGERWHATTDGSRLRAAAGRLRAADLALVNLEMPLTEELNCCTAGAPRFRFRGPNSFAGQLAAAGVDVALIANNHVFDCGLRGLESTLAALRAAGVQPAGLVSSRQPLVEPVVLRAGDVRVVVLAATDRRPRMRLPGKRIALHRFARVRAELPRLVREQRAKDVADVVVVSLHTGREHARWPLRSMAVLARELIDAGADLVLGHHTHSAQPVELRGTGAIAYGLGELSFDARPSAERHPALFTFELARQEHGRFRVETLEVEAIADAPDAKSAAFLDALAERSRRLGTELLRSGKRLVWRR